MKINIKRFLALGMVVSFAFICPSPSTAENTASVNPLKRLHDIKKRGESLSEEEFDEILLGILAEEGSSLHAKKVRIRKILAWASQLFRRDMDINFGEKENLPPRTELLIQKIEVLQDAPYLWSHSLNEMVYRIISLEAKGQEITDQELEKTLLAVFQDEVISLDQKKKEINLLLYFASPDPTYIRAMPPIITTMIKKEDDLKKQKAIAEREKLRIFRLGKEKEALAQQRKLALRRLKEEELKLRGVKQCSKKWASRKPGLISGAFGITFGCKFDPDLAIGGGSLVDGTPMYRFYPVNKFRSFSRYYVLITPKTHRVYGIWGVGDVENTEIGKKEQAVIVSLLEGKYGKREESGLVNNLYDAISIRQNSRYITVKVSGIVGDFTIDVRYYDNKLRELAEEERIEIESKKVDSAGF